MPFRKTPVCTVPRSLTGFNTECGQSSATDQFGCVNWIIQDPWVYPSNAAFLDDTVAGIIGDFALTTTIVRGTVLGQGGLICGYGKAVEFEATGHS